MSNKSDAIVKRAAKLADEMTEKLMLLEDDSKTRITAAAMMVAGLAAVSCRIDLPRLVILVSTLYADAERHIREENDE